MLKVFLKIPGVVRPYAVVGKLLFEDERYLVISQDVLKKKILWENILYIEEISSFEKLEDGPSHVSHEPDMVAAPEVDVPVGPSKMVSEKISLTVAFTGALNRLFTIEGVDRSVIESGKWTPDLAKIVFSNQEIKTVLGSFTLKDISIEGPNITITTHSDKAEPSAVMAEMQGKVDLMNQLARAATKFGAPKSGRVSMRLPTDFSMSSSPFERTVPLANDVVEDIDVSYREEEGAGES
jgi:hypothetical protein